MRIETLTKRDDLLIRRLVLEPGEATAWHTDACHRFSVVIRGERLRIEFLDGEPLQVAVHPGLADWDAPEPRIHRAVNVGAAPYEEVVTFFLPAPSVDPQPEAPPGAVPVASRA